MPGVPYKVLRTQYDELYEQLRARATVNWDLVGDLAVGLAASGAGVAFAAVLQAAWESRNRKLLENAMQPSIAAFVDVSAWGEIDKEFKVREIPPFYPYKSPPFGGKACRIYGVSGRLSAHSFWFGGPRRLPRSAPGRFYYTFAYEVPPREFSVLWEGVEILPRFVASTLTVEDERYSNVVQRRVTGGALDVWLVCDALQEVFDRLVQLVQESYER